MKRMPICFINITSFDIEESLVDLIDDEQWNENGEVWLSAVDLAI